MLKNKFIIYTEVAILATFTDWTLFYILTHFVNIDHKISVIFGLAAGAIVNYFMNKYITFKDPTKKIIEQLSLFIIFNIIAAFLSFLLMAFWVDLYHFPRMPSRIGTTLVLFFFNYFANKGIVFNWKIYSKN